MQFAFKITLKFKIVFKQIILNINKSNRDAFNAFNAFKPLIKL